ncbi:hypothetical protein [Chryseobacterium sp.]|uniref:hypothetical protein n=1 Tax=Chryseobacterium sp. TaxID=1871047 RepID=UPI00289CD479|nr:hypothetical protein [Chryseobacterium sp.]
MKKYSLLLSIILLLISCSKTKKTDIGAIYFSDKNCLEEIEKPQIENYLKNELSKINLGDGVYSILVKLD